MDRAYKGENVRKAAVEKGVPPKRNRQDPWGYDKDYYKRRNEIERYFLRLYLFRYHLQCCFVRTGSGKFSNLFSLISAHSFLGKKS